MEQAAYELLRHAAALAGDEQTVDLAEQIGAQEEAMGARLESLFDRAVAESLDGLAGPDLEAKPAVYLADAHAIEVQAIELLRRSTGVSGPAALSTAFEEHLAESEEHERLIAARLEQLGDGPSRLKDAALRLGALNWGVFFRSQPDTPAKLAGFAYAFEHLEIASYELLGRVAALAGDEQTRALAERILVQERAAAERVHGLMGEAMDAGLQAQGVA